MTKVVMLDMKRGSIVGCLLRFARQAGFACLPHKSGAIYRIITGTATVKQK